MGCVQTTCMGIVHVCTLYIVMVSKLKIIMNHSHSLLYHDARPWYCQQREIGEKIYAPTAGGEYGFPHFSLLTA